MNTTTTFAAVSTWIPTADAKSLRDKLIADGTYNKAQIKLSSYRWADVKDHDKGYLCRVMAVKGIKPELEVGEAGRSRKSKNEIASFVTELNTANTNSEPIKLRYFHRRNNVDETMTA